MPKTIEITQKRAERLAALIRERDEIAKQAQADINAKNELISGLIEAHLIAARVDPDAPKGNVAVKIEGGKHFLEIDDPPPTSKDGKK